MESSDVLPSLLEEGYQEVDTHVNVLSELFDIHISGADRGSEAEYLLQLESDGGSQFLDLLFNVLRLTDGDRELVDLVEHITTELWDLLHQRLGGDKLLIWLGPLLDELLILVELLETIDINARKADLLSLIAVSSSTDKSNLLS